MNINKFNIENNTKPITLDNFLEQIIKSTQESFEELIITIIGKELNDKIKPNFYSFRISKYSLGTGSSLFGNKPKNQYLFSMYVKIKTLNTKEINNPSFSVYWEQMISSINNKENFNNSVHIYYHDIAKHIEFLSNQLINLGNESINKLPKLFSFNNLLYDFYQYNPLMYENYINIVCLFGEISTKRENLNEINSFIDWMSNYIDLLKETKGNINLLQIDSFNCNEFESMILNNYTRFENKFGYELIYCCVNNDLYKMLKNSRLAQIFQLSYLFQLFQLIYLLFGFHKLEECNNNQFEEDNHQFNKFEIEKFILNGSLVARPKTENDIKSNILKFKDIFNNLLAILSNDFSILLFPGSFSNEFQKKLLPTRIPKSESQKKIFYLLKCLFNRI